MCGIAGIFHFDKNRFVDKGLLRKMTDIIKHRGPDGEGFYINKNIGFGHRRLSIIDLYTGDQPMFNMDRSIVIVFNGEIYNYLELKEELKKKGHNFITASDTEVILHAYEEWDKECLKKFNGMWAFAIWDDNKKQMFLSRDRIGEKPLYYAVSKNSLIFGSEIKSILAYGLPKEPGLELLDIYLTLGYIPAPYTFYKGIDKLKAGHYLIVKDGSFREYKYWDLPDIDEKNMLANENDIYEKFEYLLKNSVQLRIRSDVPFGAFLSGGLDSASVVALMTETSNCPIKTFTIGFNEKGFDESKSAKVVSDKFNTEHYKFIVKPDLFEESLAKVSFHYDEPFGDSSAILTGYVSGFASQYVKMVLTGDGGDEVLSGYTSYQGEKFALQYQQLPNIIKNNLPSFINKFSKILTGGIRYKLNRVSRILYSSNLDFISRVIYKSSWANINSIKSLIDYKNNFYKVEDYFNDFMKNCKYHDDFYKLMYFNFKLSLPDDMLVKVDRMSMAYSLETRIPFLDYRLIDFMIRVDKSVKMKGYERKSVLRESVAKKLPYCILTAPKRGFVVPLLNWFKEKEFEPYFSKLVDINNLPINKNVLKNMIESHKKGKENLGNFIWMIFVLEKFLSK